MIDNNIRLVYEWHKSNIVFKYNMKDCVKDLRRRDNMNRKGRSFLAFMKDYVVV